MQGFRKALLQSLTPGPAIPLQPLLLLWDDGLGQLMHALAHSQYVCLCSCSSSASVSLRAVSYADLSAVFCPLCCMHFVTTAGTSKRDDLQDAPSLVKDLRAPATPATISTLTGKTVNSMCNTRHVPATACTAACCLMSRDMTCCRDMTLAAAFQHLPACSSSARVLW